MKEQIPLYKTQNTIGTEVLNAIGEVLGSGWLTMGPKTVEFERIFSDYIGCTFGIATNSCTSALFLALDGLKIKKGDFVVLPVNTFVATANVVRMLGAEPIFCDVAEDGVMDVIKLESILETQPNIRCVIPVHLYGFPCDMDKISRLVKKYRVKMIEDCAQSTGAKFDHKAVGSFGDAGCFSFYATKNITTGEGGMLVTNKKDVTRRALLMRNHGQNKTPKQKSACWKYDVSDIGFNFRMSEIAAAIGVKQMEKLDGIIKSRQEIAKRYKEELGKISGIEMLHDPESDDLRQCVFHLLEVKIQKPYPLKRNELYRYLQEEGITTGVHYPPLHYLSYYKRTTKYRKGDFPCAETLFSRVLSLPMFPFMTDHEFQKIIQALKSGSQMK